MAAASGVAALAVDMVVADITRKMPYPFAALSTKIESSVPVSVS